MRSRLLSVVLCLFALTPLLVLAQQQISVPAGEIRGVVRDAAGGLIPGATIQVLQGGTVVQQTVSAADGAFAIRGLKPGSYTVVVLLAGFTPEQRAMTLFDKSGVFQTFTLTVGAVSERVEVSSAAVTVSGNPAPASAPAPKMYSGVAGGRGAAVDYMTAHPGHLPPGYNRESYAHVERNGFRLVKDEPLSTFSA